MMKRFLYTSIAFCLASQPALAAATFDVAINNGRVIDPETRLDAIRSIGIRDGRIVTISRRPLAAKRQIDASGLVVAPGFIDVHSHAMTIPSAWMQAHDGVTTALELEIGAWPVGASYERMAAAGWPINYGFSVSWFGARQSLLGSRADSIVPEAESRRVVDLVAEGLAEGGIGVGFPLGHHPDTNRSEYLEISRIAARWDAPTFTHLRTKNTHEPRGVIEGATELIGVAAATGARMHLCHVNSSALRETPRILAMIAGAQARGLHVTTEAYPWGAGSTRISTPFLDPDNLPLLDLEPGDIAIVATGERVRDRAELERLRKAAPSTLVAIHYLDERDETQRGFIEQAIRFPGSLIVSDAIPYIVGNEPLTAPRWPLPDEAMAHPRIAASFTKVIADYVLDRRTLPLGDMIERATLLPARLLEPSVPDMRRKGRIQPGADADIVAFDLASLAVHADFDHPARPSTGMKYVLVAGSLLIDGGEIRRDRRDGRPVRGRTKSADKSPK
ncbi:amidohydrolase family protein [Sphingopyxis kveilinensis]|uniref:amidohydrolase family protein n=1 Tax=Sphingopyxis kveilinensis TaxID=3114367 RepID=UPI0030CBC129